MINNLHKNASPSTLLLLGFLFFQLAAYSQSPVAYTVDVSTTGYTLKKAFGLPGGKSGVISLTEANHFFCTVVNSNGTLAGSFDITNQLSLQTTTNYIEINAIGTPSGNIFITYTSPGTDNITNANARYLVLSQSSGATIAAGNVNATLPTGTILNRYLDLAVLSNGNVVVTWEIHQENADHSTTASSESGVFRIFTETGAAVTSDIVFGGPGSSISTPILNCFGAKVAANSGGGFLIFFYNYLGNFRAIRFDNSGTAQSTGGANAFLVDPSPWTGNFHLYKALGLANGSYMLFYSRSQIGYYKVISAAGVDVKAITSITDIDLAKEVKTNGRVETVPVNTTGKQGFAIATEIFENYNDLNNPNTKVRVYNYDLSGTFLTTSDLTAYFYADLQPLFLVYSGLPSGIGVAYRTYKTFTTSANGAIFPADADLKGVTLDFDLPTVSSITRKTPTAATTNATSVTYQVVFSTPVTGVSASDFALTSTGGVTGTIGTVSGTGTTYTVQVNSIGGNGTLRLDLNSSGTGIVSGGGTAIASGFTTGEVYTFDHTAPTLTPVMIASNNANPLYAKVGDKITINFTASETLQTPTVTIAGQSATVSNVTGNQWKGEFTMTNSQTEGLVTFSIVFSDPAGNAGSTVNAVTTGGGSVTFDKTAPTISSISRSIPANATTDVSTVILRVTYSETVNNIDINDFTLALTGTVTATIASVSATSGSTADVTVNNVSGEGSLGLNGKNTGVSDNAGNSIATGLTGETYTYLGPPSVTSINRQNPTNGITGVTSVIYRITFTKPVTGVDENDFILTATGTVTGTIASVSAFGTNDDTYDVTVNTNVGDGTMRLDLKSTGTGITDAVANAITGGFTTGEFYTFDHTAPTLTSVGIVSNNTNTAYAKVGDIITLNFSASEPVGTPTVTIATHSVTATPAAGNSYTATYTMLNTDAESLVPFTINFSDAAANAGTQVTTTTNSGNVTFDRTVPSVTINQTGAVDPTSSTTIHFTVVFSELVTGFVTGEVTLGGTAGGSLTGIVSEIAPMNGTTYDVAVTGMTTDGTITASIGANKATDAAGNVNTVSTSTDNTITWLSDQPPVVTSINRQTPSVQLTNTTTVTFRVTFSENVTGVVASDFSLTLPVSGLTAFIGTVSGSGSIYDVQVNTILGNGTVGLNLNSSGTGIKDIDGITQDNITGGFSGQVYTIDQIVPTLSQVTIASNNGNPAYAKTGDVVTLTFTADEQIKSPAISIAGHTSPIALINTSGNTWTAAYTMVSGDAEGLVTFIIAFTDLAGNGGTQATSTTNSSSVTFDKTAPTLTTVHIQSNNTNTAKAKDGDIVTLSFTANEAITVTSVGIAGHPVAVTPAGGNSYTASWTMASGDIEGAVTFSISGFKDAASNTGVTVTATTDANNVTFDKTAPTLSPVTIVSDNTNTSYAKVGGIVTVTFTSSEAIRTPTVTIATHSVTPTNTSANIWSATYTMISGDMEGAVPFTTNFSDLTGNAGTQVSITTNASSVMFDKTPPTLTTVTISSNNADPAKAKVGDVVTVNFTSFEAIGTPTATIATHTATITPLGGNNYKATYAMAITDVEGNVSFSISFSDLAGNAGVNVTAVTNSSAVSFDRTLPALTSVHIQSGNANSALAKIPDLITLTFTASEPITGTTVTIAGQSATVNSAGGNSYTATHTVIAGDADGLVSFSISGFKDGTSNTGVAVTGTIDGSSVTIDKMAPTLSPVTIASNNSNTSYAKLGDKVTLLFSASEAVQTPSVSILGHAVTPSNVTGNQWKAEYTTTNTDAEGTIAFQISNLKDLVGNNGSNASTITTGSSVIFDKTAPVIDVCPGSQTPSVGTNCTANVIWTVPKASDANMSSPFNAYAHTGGDPGSLAIGTYNIVYQFKDPAGNESTCSFTVTVADKSGPTFTTPLTANPIVIWPPDHKLKDISLTYATADNCSGTVTNTITVTSTDPITGVSDGDKSPDWIMINEHLVQLRAERGNGREARIYTITVTPKDASGNIGTAQSVNIYIAHNITAPITGTSFKIGSTIDFGGAFWDKQGNKHTAEWLIDDNTVVKGTVTEPSGTKNGKVTGSYKFSNAGIYKLQMNITDQNKMTSYCNTNEDMEAIVVVYDPNGGYTYGGGWFNSPAGALKSDATATGKVNFGYAVSYFKGASNPKGETQFELKVGDLEFNALNFDYLSIDGSKAQFKGTGKITGGQSGINFIMTVIDGALDGTGIDKVRIKIYNKNTGQVYYDNEPGSSDAANPATKVGANSQVVIGGGNVTTGSSPAITILNAPAIQQEVYSLSKLEAKVFPNPSYRQFTLAAQGGNCEQVTIRITDVLGRLVEVRNGLSGNGTLTLGASYRPGVYIAEVLQGKEKVVLKLVKQRD